MPFLSVVKGIFAYFAQGQAVRLPNEAKSHILHFCDLSTLLELYHEPVWRDLAATELLLSYNAIFKMFTPDPAAFRAMMRDTDSIISGSTALYFLLRQPSEWKPGDVDIIAAGKNFHTLLAFIQTLPGATVVSDTLDEGEQDADTYPYFGLRRLVKVSTTMAQFDVIQSSGTVASNAIVHYWGTHVMNAITANNVICAYPTLTLAYKAIQIREPAGGHAVEKYRRRGFNIFARGGMVIDVNQACSDTAACSSRDRYFGDDATLIIPIAQQVNPGTRPMADDRERTPIFRASAWRLGGRACGTANCYLSSSSRFEEVTVISGVAQRRAVTS